MVKIGQSSVYVVVEWLLLQEAENQFWCHFQIREWKNNISKEQLLFLLCGAYLISTLMPYWSCMSRFLSTSMYVINLILRGFHSNKKTLCNCAIFTHFSQKMYHCCFKLKVGQKGQNSVYVVIEWPLVLSSAVCYCFRHWLCM